MSYDYLPFLPKKTITLNASWSKNASKNESVFIFSFDKDRYTRFLMSGESEQRSQPVPFYTKVGWIAAWIVMVILSAMILKNCVSSVKYGSQTEQQTVDTYYQLGMKDATLGNEFYLPADVMSNPVLRKAYNKGYREAMDKQRLSAEK